MALHCLSLSLTLNCEMPIKLVNFNEMSLSLYARVLMTGLMSLRLAQQQQQSRRTTMGRDSRTQRKSGREGEMAGGDCEGPRQFTVCSIALQLSLYSDMCFLLFDHGMI